jgi:hypothetical protein
MSAALAFLVISGCGAEPQVASTEAASAAATPAAETAAVAATSARDFLPELTDEGTLPRTLERYTLLDPAPADATEVTGFSFKGSVSRADIVRPRPRAEIRAYALDDQIFRVEYDDYAAPPMPDLIRVGLERYGKPFQQQDDEVIWIRDGRSLMVRHFPKGGNTQIVIEDEKGVLKAHRRAR